MGLERKEKRDLPATLWEYALVVYNRDDVAAACLAAQDGHGLDVNLLLFAAWLARRERGLDEAAVRQADDLSRAWREEVVRPLRCRRRAWRRTPPHARAYAAIKVVEIEAERQQLLMLAELALDAEFLAACPRDGGACAAARLAANLQAVARSAGAPECSVAALVTALEQLDTP